MVLRFAKALDFCCEEHVSVRSASFCSLWTALRYWCFWLIEKTHVYGCSEPPLLDLLTPRFSPAQRILQYLRSLTVSDPHDRFFLVHTLAGCSRQEFVRSHPLSRQFRSGVMAMSAWMYWRCEKYHHTPYILAKLSDSRITEKERLRTAILVFSTNPCCLDPPLSRK